MKSSTRGTFFIYRRDIVEKILIECVPPYALPITVNERRKLEKELAEIDQLLQTVRTDTAVKKLELIASLGFVAERHTDETKSVLNKFRALRRKISDEYTKGSILEVTLEQLTS